MAVSKAEMVQFLKAHVAHRSDDDHKTRIARNMKIYEIVNAGAEYKGRRLMDAMEESAFSGDLHELYVTPALMVFESAHREVALGFEGRMGGWLTLDITGFDVEDVDSMSYKEMCFVYKVVKDFDKFADELIKGAIEFVKGEIDYDEKTVAEQEAEAAVEAAEAANRIQEKKRIHDAITNIIDDWYKSEDLDIDDLTGYVEELIDIVTNIRDKWDTIAA